MPISKITNKGMGAGAVLQVVQTTATIPAVSTTSTTYSDTGYTATITPTSATSKILVIAQHFGCGKNGISAGLNLRLVRNGTSIQIICDAGFYNGVSTDSRFNIASGCYLDSPATTSALTYKTQLASYNGNGTVYVNDYGNTSPVGTFTLMEIAA